MNCVTSQTLSEVRPHTQHTQGPQGQATAHYLSDLVHDKGIRVSRIAQGVPLGGELEFVDSSTLDHAIGERQSME